MFRIVMSIVFIVILVGAYFLSNGSNTSSQPEIQQAPQSGSTFNNL